MGQLFQVKGVDNHPDSYSSIVDILNRTLGDPEQTDAAYGYYA
jgi:hypothetical protein